MITCCIVDTLGSTSPTDSTGDSEGALDESDDVSEPLQQDSDGIVDEQPAFDGVQQVDPQGPHGVVNQQQTVPLTIWQRFTRMFRSTPPPLVSPLEPNGMLFYFVLISHIASCSLSLPK